VSNSKRRISYVTVAALFQSQSAQPKQDALPLGPEETVVTVETVEAVEAVEAPEADTPPVEAASFEEGRSTRYAGAMMLFAALTRLGFLTSFRISAPPLVQRGGLDGRRRSLLSCSASPYASTRSRIGRTAGGGIWGY
jgi:hypothetical protein